MNQSGTDNELRLVRLGIDPLDRISGGGVQPGSLLVILGPSGSGVSMFALHFIMRGVADGERGAVLLTTRKRWEILRSAKYYGMALEEAVNAGIVRIIELENPFVAEEISSALIELLDAIEAGDATRVYIDTIDPLLMTLGPKEFLAQVIAPLLEASKKRGTVTLIRCMTPRVYRRMAQFATGAFRIEWNPLMPGGGTLRRVVIDKLRDVPTVLHSAVFEIRKDVGVSVVEAKGIPRWRKVVSTGVPGLDGLVGGGYPSGSVVLVTGEPGAGKTYLGLSFVLEAARSGSRGLIVSYSDTERDLLDRLRSIDGDAVQMVSVTFRDPFSSSLEGEIMWLREVLAREEPSALLVDGLDLLALEHEWKGAARVMRAVQMWTRESGGVALVTLVEEAGSKRLSPLADVILWLNLEEAKGSLFRTLRIVKSKFAPSDTRIVGFEITDEGPRVVV